MLVEQDIYGRAAPAHVPQELLRRIDIFNDPVLATDPFALLRRLREEPPLVYNLSNPLKGQSWLATKASTIRHITSHPDLFSAAGQTGFAQLNGEDWRMGPIEMDPPEHGKFRKLMNPWFSPPVVAKLSEKIRARAIGLIEPLVAQGGCDFMQAFAVPFPMTIFLDFFGLPYEDLPVFLGWVEQLLHSDNPESSAAGARAIGDFLRALLADRTAHPRDDIPSKIAHATIDGQPASDGDKLGSAYVLFTGGLDTVTASLGFHYLNLARNPDLQAQLRADPAARTRAIEELLRVHSPVHASRMATCDTVVEGTEVRKGDWVTLLYGLGSLDQAEFGDADEMDLDRRSNRHFAFGFGNHFCMGSHLARLELQIAMEEWLARIPPFRLADPDTPPPTRGGFVFGVKQLDLQW